MTQQEFIDEIKAAPFFEEMPADYLEDKKYCLDEMMFYRIKGAGIGLTVCLKENFDTHRFGSGIWFWDFPSNYRSIKDLELSISEFKIEQLLEIPIPEFQNFLLFHLDRTTQMI